MLNVPLVTSQVCIERLQSLRHVALDMDGTIYKGRTLFNVTVPFLSLLQELGITYSFLTNNPSKNLADYLKHLRELGINATADQLYTSTHATIEYLKSEWPAVHRLFALGTPSMCAEFGAAGFELVADDPEDEPDAVIVGFDSTLTYPGLCRAAWWIGEGKPWFGTNPDKVCPTDQPTVLVDCGAICAALETATGRKPNAVLGKPDPLMLRGILKKKGIGPEALAMVGDRLYTDMAMARRAGALGVLVLTGETTAEQARKCTPPPDVIVPSLKEFGLMLREAREG